MLRLSNSFVSFESDSRVLDQSGNVTQNFFDDASSKVCTVRNNGGLGITCKSLSPNDVISVRTQDRGASRLVKLAPNSELAILQRQNNSVDIVILKKINDGLQCAEFNVASKSKENIISVEFASDSLAILVTNQCMELHQLNKLKKTSKILKSMNISASWSVYYPDASFLILSTGINSSTLQPVLVQHQQFVRLKSFDVDFGVSSSKENLLAKDVTIASIYGKLYVMVLRYSVRNSSNTDLALYEISNDPNIASKMKYSLALGFTGGFGIHIIDNLVIVHHQVSSRSLIFDVALALNRPSHSPLITTSIVAHDIHPTPALYPPMWSIFQPNIIIDPLSSVMYELLLDCQFAKDEIKDKSALIEFLIHRSGSKNLVISNLFDSLKHKLLRLRQIRKIFDLLAEKYVASTTSVTDTSKLPKIQSKGVDYLKIEQKELQSRLFIPLQDDITVDKKYISNVMLQYLRSLHKYEISIEAYFLELLVQTMASAGEMNKLHQLVTYKVVSDCKPLAFLLLSYEARCPSLYQSAIDILSRQKACDEIVEVLLDKGHVVDAIRYVESQAHNDLSGLKVLEASTRRERSTTFSVLTYLLDRKSKNGDTTNLTKMLKTLYSEEEINEAEKETATSFLL